MSCAHKYALTVVAAYAAGRDNAFEVYQQYWPYDAEEESDLEYVYRCAADLDWPDGEASLVYLDLWESNKEQSCQE